MKTLNSKFVFTVGIAAHYTRPRTWHVEEHPVNFALEVGEHLNLVVVHLSILDSCTFQTLLGLQQNGLSDVVHINLACVVHEGREAECLASRPSTVINNDLLGLTIYSLSKEL